MGSPTGTQPIRERSGVARAAASKGLPKAFAKTGLVLKRFSLPRCGDLASTWALGGPIWGPFRGQILTVKRTRSFQNQARFSYGLRGFTRGPYFFDLTCSVRGTVLLADSGIRPQTSGATSTKQSPLPARVPGARPGVCESLGTNTQFLVAGPHGFMFLRHLLQLSILGLILDRPPSGGPEIGFLTPFKKESIPSYDIYCNFQFWA